MNKLRRQRNKYRQEIRAEEDRFFELVNGIYVGGRQDAPLVLKIDKNSKSFMKTTLEENYVMVGEPEGFYWLNSCSSHTQCYQGYRVHSFYDRTHQYVNCCFGKAFKETITLGYLSTALCGVAYWSWVYCFR